MEAETRLALDSRLLAITENKRVIEVWRFLRAGVSSQEREIQLPKEVLKRVVNGRQQCCEVYKYQKATRERGRFEVRRYHAERVRPWGAVAGLLMLITGTVLAAISANHEAMQVPLSVGVIAVGLLAVGALLMAASGGQVFVRPSFSGSVVSFEALGLSTHALGFSNDVVALDSLPAGYKPSHFIASMEIDVPVGDWKVVGEYSTDAGWYRAA